MKKIYPHLTGLIYLFILCFSTTQLVAQTETEDNGSFVLANPLSQGTTINASVGLTDVNDYFLTVPDNDGTVKLYFNFSTSVPSNDFFVYVYNKNGSQVGNNFLYDTGIGALNDSITVYCRQQDTIYFRFSTNGFYNYSFTYNTIPSGSSDFEPNDALANADYTAFGDTARGRIGYTSVAADQDDYFYTVLPSFGTVNYYLEALNTSGSNSSDIFSYVYNKNGSLIGSSFLYDQTAGSTIFDTITIHCRELDTIYFRVASSGCFSYKFHYDVVAPTQNDLEPNNTLASATQFIQTNLVEGRIGSVSVGTDDNDYFYSVLPDDGTLKYYLSYYNTSGSTSSDIFSYIYNKNGSQIGTSFKYDQPLGLNFDTITVYCRQADTVYFRISSNSCFSYSFNYEVIPSGTNDIEPNNTLLSSTFFSPDQPVSGRIGYASISADPDDYFGTVLPDDGTLNLFVTYNNTSGSTSADFFTYIYNKNGSQIGTSFRYDQPLGISIDTITVYCRQADTVYFRFASNYCFSYSFNYEVIPSGDADLEPNNTSLTATSFNYNEMATGRIGYTSVSTDNDDYYLSVLPEDGTVRYIVNYNNISGSTSSDFFSYIYNKNGSQIGTKFSYDVAIGMHSDTIDVPCRLADTLYFRITSNACFSYEFGYQMLNTSIGDAEPNNTSQEAIPINLNQTFRGKIGYGSISVDNDDYFSFTINGFSSITNILEYTNTSSSNSSDIFFYLYNAAGSQVWTKFNYDQPTGVTLDTIQMNCLPAGNYTFRVSSNGCFNYAIKLNIQDNQPDANILYSRFGNTFSFISDVFRTDSVAWDFDDGTTSSLNFPQKEFGIGAYDVTLTAFNQTCNIQDKDTLTIMVNGIESYAPKRAGKGGMVGFFNIQIYGGGLSETTSVELKQGGATLIPFQIGSPSGAELNLLFSFLGANTGFYDLKITLASGEVYEFPNGFEIFEDAADFNITTEVSGPSIVRTNRWTSYTLNVHNDRARLANGVMAMILLPRNVETNFNELYLPKTGEYVIKGDEWDRISLDMDDFENTYFQGSLDRFADSVVINYDSIYAYVDSTFAIDIDSLYGEAFTGTLHPLYIPIIDANGTYSFNFQLKSPTNGNLKVLSYAWPFTFRDNPSSGEILEYVHEGGLQAAAVAEYAPNPALRFVGRNAGKIDIGSQIAFTEFFDWYYGVNNADEEFYAKQGTALAFEVAGELAPVNGDKAKASAKRYRDRIKNETEHLNLLKSSVRPPNKITPEMANRISKRLEQYKEKIAQLGEFATDAEKYAAMDDLRNYLSKRGLNLTQKELEDLLFSDDSKVNKPKEISEEDITSITSRDPNAIYGNKGFTENKYISTDRMLDYMITFENVDTALAPAQIVKIEMNLDPTKFDLNTFSLGSIAIAENAYYFRQNRKEFYRDIDLRPAKNIIVRVNARADTITGNVLWQFSSLEPETGEFLDNPLDGFLPPNMTIPEGEGSVSFSVKLKENLAHNDSISAFANIYFDENEAIVTNIWRNKIDKSAPVSTLNPSITLLNDTTMKLSYSGTDSGSGIRDFYLKAKVNDGDWIGADFLVSEAGTFEVTGTQGFTYSFYLFSRDSVGNSESENPVIQASITLRAPESNFDPEFLIYPNPNQGQLFVKSNGNFEDTRVSIYNIYGQMTFNSTQSFFMNQSKQFSLPDLAQGVYMIRFENKAGKVKTKRFVYIPN